MMRRAFFAASLATAVVLVDALGCSDEEGGGVPGSTLTTSSSSTGSGAAAGSSSSCELGGGGSEPLPQGLGDLTGSWQLFVDDDLIEQRPGVVRRYHSFEKDTANPVMVADRPWEDHYAYLYGRVLPEESGTGYRMWYSSLDFSATYGESRVLYATSSDGRSWDKPALGIRSYDGSTDNNMFIPRERPNHILSILHTPWDPDPSCRYKLINFDGSYEALPAGYQAACSPDGVHLTDLPNNPVIDAATVGVGDVAQFTWDPWQQRYLGYVKVATETGGLRRRSVALTTTDDFAHWPTTAPPVVLEPDAIDDVWATSAGLDLATARTHFYGVSVFPYESLFVGMLWIFRSEDPPGCTHDCEPYTGYIFGKIHVELATSRDGERWTRAEGDAAAGRPALLELGPAGAWDSMMVFTANHPLLEGDELRLWYGGCDEDHALIGTTGGSAAIGLATLRKDGFCSLEPEAEAEEATITTKPLAGLGGELHLNYRAASGGSVRVELQDAQGGPIAGYGADDCSPLEGDETDATVRWGATTTLPMAPCEIRIALTLRDAAVYSFMGGPRVRLAAR